MRKRKLSSPHKPAAEDRFGINSSVIALERLGCVATKCSLELPESLSAKAYCTVGRYLGEIVLAVESITWLIGDWWVCGEQRYSERTALISSDDWNGPSLRTCMNAATVGRVFETSAGGRF